MVLLHDAEVPGDIRVLLSERHRGSQQCRYSIGQRGSIGRRRPEGAENMFLGLHGRGDVQACLASEMVIEGGCSRVGVGQDGSDVRAGEAVSAEVCCGRAK